MALHNRIVECKQISYNVLSASVICLQARVTIQNFYRYRHIDNPGWSLGWTWAKNEVIWSMRGAFATDMGNCSSFTSQIPHSCKKNPVIADLMLDQASPDNMTEGCCRGGTLYPSSIDPSKSFASFEVQVGSQEGNATIHVPHNLTLMAPGPGYSCGPLLDSDPTISSDIGGRRHVPVFSMERHAKFTSTIDLTIEYWTIPNNYHLRNFRHCSFCP